MLIAVSLFAAGILGIGYILARNIPKAASLPEEEIIFIRTAQGPFFSYVGRRFKEGAAYVWHSIFRPAFMSFAVKSISRLRISILRFEQQLLRLVSRLRSRSALVPKPSAYWQEVYSWKSADTRREVKEITFEPLTAEDHKSATAPVSAPIAVAAIAVETIVSPAVEEKTKQKRIYRRRKPTVETASKEKTLSEEPTESQAV